MDTTRFRGTCYRAANWIHVGQTTGRSRQDRYRNMNVPVKDILPIQQLADTLQKIGPCFSSSLDWNGLEIFLRDALHDFIDQILHPILKKLLEDRTGFLAALKQLAARKGMRFCGFRQASVRISVVNIFQEERS